MLVRDASFFFRYKRLQQFFSLLDILLQARLNLVEVMGQELMHVLVSLRLLDLLKLL